MPRIYIDKKPFDVPAGKNLLEACLSLGLDLPYFCWHPAMGSVGACRQCAVKVFRDGEDQRGKLVMSCMEPVRDDLYLSVSDPYASAFREQVIEWLMTNHPHDCAVCDEGGSCHLQDMTVMTGHNYRRFRYRKRTYHNQYLGPFLNHEMNRCIQCYRCVRFYKDYAGGKDLDAFAAHDHVYFGRQSDGVLENEFSGNLAEVCPTGVFTDKTLKEHYTRKWDLTMAPSVCQHCSAGCNTIAGERYGGLRQITNRYNEEVNGYFICDRGRFGYEFVNDFNRIRHPLVRGHVPDAVDRSELFSRLDELLSGNELIGIGSPRASMESNFALRELVGPEHFYQGVPAVEAAMLQQILDYCRSGRVSIPSIRDMEQADAVLIIGEDVTNTAPRMALAIRQAVKRVPMEAGRSIGIPSWHDGASRELAQSDTGDLFIAYPVGGKLDELARETLYASPAEIAELGLAVAAMLAPDADPDPESRAGRIAAGLRRAKRPLIVSGTSLFHTGITEAAFRIAAAVRGSLAFVVPECNSMGLAMTGAPSFQAIPAGPKIAERKPALIILEDDLYRHSLQEQVDGLYTGFGVVSLDHLHHRGTNNSEIVIPVATFAEGDGTLINYEGRAQRFFQVFKPESEDIRESWRWLERIRQLREGTVTGRTRTIGELQEELVRTWPQFAGIERMIPEDFSIAGQKIPREPHRYSGRTAMQAHHHVSEPKPPEDPDSPLSFTMEGFRGIPPAPLTPYFWSPGWNSAQAVNKYQVEIGGPLHGFHAGVRLLDQAGTAEDEPAKTVRMNGKVPAGSWSVLPMPHIFGSEELSAYASGIRQRMPEPCLAISTEDARKFQVADGDTLSLKLEQGELVLAVRVVPEMPVSCVGVPYNIPPLTGLSWPVHGILRKEMV
ncbi:MAG TPA: NADH-quinone oxidoreductase subunit NuoG [Sphingobacteriaceae bacterium]